VQCKTLTFTLLTVFLALLILVSAYFSVFASTSSLSVKPNVYFYLSSAGTYVSFNETLHAYRIAVYQDSLLLSNAWMDGQPVDPLTVKVEGGNLTFLDFFKDKKLVFRLSAPTGTVSKVAIRPVSRPASVSADTLIYGSSYDADTNTLTVQVTHHSDVTVTVDWVASVQPTFNFPSFRQILFSGLLIFALTPVVTGAIIIFVFLKREEENKLAFIEPIIWAILTVILAVLTLIVISTLSEFL